MTTDTIIRSENQNSNSTQHLLNKAPSLRERGFQFTDRNKTLAAGGMSNTIEVQGNGCGYVTLNPYEDKSADRNAMSVAKVNAFTGDIDFGRKRV